AGHGRKGGQRRGLAHWSHDLRQAEVEELDAGLRQHDVAGFQVPVHDPLPMRLVQGVRDLDPEPEGLFRRQRALEQPVGQRFSLQVLHDQELGPVLVAYVVERADKELYYMGLDFKLMAVPVSADTKFHAGSPVALFPIHPSGAGTVYDVTSDGRRFLVNSLASELGSPPLDLLI